MRFEERELKSYAEPVTADLLEEGKVYFSVQFADSDMLIPIMETWVFAGRNLTRTMMRNVSIFKTWNRTFKGYAINRRLMKAQAFRSSPRKTSTIFLTMSGRLTS